MSVPAGFRAFRIHDDTDGYRSGIESLALDDLNPGEVVIRSAYSSVNFKDALAGTGKGKILRLADDFCVDLDRAVPELRVALGHDAVML